MRTIRYHCTHCRAVMRSSECLVGRTEVCKKCGYMNTVPERKLRSFLRFDAETGLATKVIVGVVTVGLVAFAVFMAVANMKSPTQELQAKYDELQAAKESSDTEASNLREYRDRLLARITFDTKHMASLESEQSRLRDQIQNLQSNLSNLARRPERPLQPMRPDVLSVDPGGAAPPPPTEHGPTQTYTVAAAPKAEMPKEEQDKIRRMVLWLKANYRCTTCNGSGTYQGCCCPECAAQVPTTVKMPQKELVQNGYWNSLGSRAQAWVPAQYRTVYVDAPGMKGNGFTPIMRLRPNLDLTLGLCQKYADSIPRELLTLAKGTCCGIDQNMASQFP